MISRDTLDPGVVGLSISYALTMTITLNMLVRVSSDVETNLVSVERCIEYTETPTEVKFIIFYHIYKDLVSVYSYWLLEIYFDLN